MINEIRWKFVAATAIIAMAVSLFSGGLGGIGLGTLLLRAMIGGTVFAVLAVGLNFLILRLFPEILASFHAAQDESISGSRVDIMMGDDVEGDLFQSSVDSAPVPGGDLAVDGPLSTEQGRGSNFAGEGVNEDGEEAAAVPVGDLDRFSGAFSDVEEDKSGGFRPSSDVLDGNHDSEEMAQAIHTVMERDEKG